MSAKKLTDEEKTLQRQKRMRATKEMNELRVRTTSATACTDAECPFCHRGLCTRSKCYKDTDETQRVKMPRQLAEEIETMHRLTKSHCERMVEEVGELIGLDVKKLKQYRQEQADMQRYMRNIANLKSKHNKGLNLNNKVEDIERPKMTVTFENCIASPEATAEAIQAYMTSIDFDAWREEQMRETIHECDELKRKANLICVDMHMQMQTECESMKKRTELECQIMKQGAEKYVQVGERIAANVDEIKRMLNGIISEPPADLNPPKQPKKRGRKSKTEAENGTKRERKTKKMVDPVVEQMEAGV